MTEPQRRAAAKQFAADWQGKGYEKGHSQSFWLSLLQKVYGVEEPEKFITFEDQIMLDHTSFIDGFIPSTHVLIEQKYKLANKVVHATPQGTFDRLGVPSGPRTFTPVGHSDYGLAPPAVNAAISLSMIAADYFGFVLSGDSIVNIRILTKWVNLVKKYYTDIEEKCFDIKIDSTLPEHSE